MRTLLLIVAILFTLAFDAFALWALIFTVSWADQLPPLTAVGFWLFAISPFVVTGYCAMKVRALLQDRPTRV